MKRISLIVLSFLIITTGCTKLQTVANDNDQSGKIVSVINLFAEKSKLQEDLAAPLANQDLILGMDPNHHEVQTITSTIGDVVGGVSDNALDKYGFLLELAGVTPDEAGDYKESMVGDLEGKLHNAVKDYLNDNWNSLSYSDSKKVYKSWACDITASYTVTLKELSEITAKIDSVEFLMEPEEEKVLFYLFGFPIKVKNPNRLRSHVHIKDLHAVPHVKYDIGVSGWCIKDFDFTVNHNSTLNIGDLEFDVSLELSKEPLGGENCEAGCCPDVVKSNLKIENGTISNVTKDLPKLHVWYDIGVYQFDKHIELDDEFTNEDAEEMLNEYFEDEPVLYETSKKMHFAPTLISDFELTTNQISLVRYFDQDGDGLYGACDLCPESSTNMDFDDDGLCTFQDNCAFDANSDQVDSDGDGIGDACDVCNEPNIGDKDDACTDTAFGEMCLPIGDGVDDACDNCPDVINPDQTDYDQDGMGDACDDDDDNDGLEDESDLCPKMVTSNNQDADGDGIGDPCDNCINDVNANQHDYDGDGLGNACDSDLDGDGITNDEDNCEYTNNPDQTDTDDDGAGDICDGDPNCNPNKTYCGDKEGWKWWGFEMSELFHLKACIGPECFFEILPSQIDKLIQVMNEGLENEKITAIEMLGRYGAQDKVTGVALEDVIKRSRSRAVVNAAKDALQMQKMGRYLNIEEMKTFDEQGQGQKRIIQSPRRNPGKGRGRGR